jgi:uncharacterized membrane protein
MRFSRLLLLGLVLVSVVEAVLQWNSAPSRVPSHFDAAGHANAWSSRDDFFMLQVAVSLGIGALFIGITWLLKFTPASLINLPNKNYWLAPDRRDETMERLASYLDVFGCATVALLLVVFALAARAGRGGPFATNWFLPALVAYLVFSVGWTIAFFRQFALSANER